MKVGLRKPNLEKRFKARTTGKLKRQAKHAVIPGYGRKGMGYLKDPKKALYNKMYHKATIDPLTLLEQNSKKASTAMKNRTSENIDEANKNIEDYEKTTQFLEKEGYSTEDYVNKKGSKKVRGLSIFCGLATVGFIMPENRNILLAIVFAVITYITWQKSKPTVHIRVKEEEKPDENVHQDIQLTSGENNLLTTTKHPALNRSWEEQDKKFQFHQKYYGTIQSLENNIYSSDDQLIESRIESIRAFNSLQRFCYSKGKAGKLYFDDMWLHCHNSKNSCFSFKDSIKNYLENLFAKYDQLPEVYRDDYHCFKAQRVADLKEILKENNLPVSGKKEELVNRLIENNVKPAIDGDTQKKVEENKEIILQNKAYIKENKPLILYYLREPDIPENVFQNSFNQLKEAWGFTPSYNDVLWGALEQLKLHAMETSDTVLYAKITEDEIEILEMEGKHDQAQELQKQLRQLGKL